MGARSNGQLAKPTKFFIDGEQKEFLFQQDIAPFLRSYGYGYTVSQINKLCAPAVNEGPPIALWQGPRPLRTPEDVVAWAEKRLLRANRSVRNSMTTQPARNPKPVRR
jgi:hypothetical protein